MIEYERDEEYYASWAKITGPRGTVLLFLDDEDRVEMDPQPSVTDAERELASEIEAVLARERGAWEKPPP